MGEHQEIATNLAENADLLQQSSPCCSQNHSANMFLHKTRETFFKLPHHGRPDQNMLIKNKNHQFYGFSKTIPKNFNLQTSHRRHTTMENCRNAFPSFTSRGSRQTPIFHHWYLHLPKLLISLRENYTKKEPGKSVTVSFNPAFQNVSDEHHHTI